jgi:ribosomal-protein-alanine N-acetyltransferase
MTARVERLQAADVAAVAEIDAEAFPRTASSAEHVSEELARPWTRAWVAHVGEAVVGYLLAWHVADEVHILQVATRARVRRNGYGRALVEAALEYAATERARLVLLEVRRSNAPAIALYRALGFATTNFRFGYYADGEDAVEMLAEIDPATGARVARVDEIEIGSEPSGATGEGE